jgi:hypothetical protein
MNEDMRSKGGGDCDVHIHFQFVLVQSRERFERAELDDEMRTCIAISFRLAACFHMFLKALKSTQRHSENREQRLGVEA